MSERPPEIGALSDLGRDYLAGRLRQEPLRGVFRPSRRDDVTELARLDAAAKANARADGLRALRAGSVAFGVLAAGASTRMDLSTMPPRARRLLERAGRKEPKSKALVPVVELGGEVLSFLDLFFVNVARLSAATGSSNPAVILVSEANAEEIEGEIARKRCFGLRPQSVVAFRQTLDRQIVATVEDVERAAQNFGSRADLDAALELSRAFAGHDLEMRKPAGHGEFLHQLVSSGTLGRLLERGIRHLSIRNIDNVGARFDADWLVLLGLLIERRKRFLVEVSRRPDGPAGKGGALIVRPGGVFQLAEDPAFRGTGIDPLDSYYINDATAILEVGYLFRIYETSEAEILSAPPARLAEIAERGRRKFPPLVDVKPVRLPSGGVVGAFVRETNLWESTGVAPDLGVDAVGVPSVKDVEAGFDELPPNEQRSRAVRVRFVATKKWEDYEGINARLVPYLADQIVRGDLLAG